MKYKYIFWDWNGTLLDDASASWQAVNTMLERRNLPIITLEQYRETVEVPIVKFYETVMDMSKETLDGLSVEFNALWRSYLRDKPLSEGAYELLGFLKDNGIKNYIYSSSQNKIILPHLDALNIAKYFSAVLGANDCYVSSKIERTRDFIKASRFSPNEILFVGDMDHDNDVASLVGADCVLVSYGHQSVLKLRKTGRRVMASLKELRMMLESEL